MQTILKEKKIFIIQNGFTLHTVG